MEECIGILQADTLIRATLHMDPDMLTDAEWVHHTTQALWMEQYRVVQISKLFGD